MRENKLQNNGDRGQITESELRKSYGFMWIDSLSCSSGCTKAILHVACVAYVNSVWDGGP